MFVLQVFPPPTQLVQDAIGSVADLATSGDTTQSVSLILAVSNSLSDDETPANLTTNVMTEEELEVWLSSHI